MPTTSTAPASQPAPVGRGTLLTSTVSLGLHSTALTTGEPTAGSTTGTDPRGSRPVGPTMPSRSVGGPSSGSRVSTPESAQPLQRVEDRRRGSSIGPWQFAVGRVVAEVVRQHRGRDGRPGGHVEVAVEEATAEEARPVAPVVVGDRGVAQRDGHRALARLGGIDPQGRAATTVVADVDVVQPDTRRGARPLRRDLPDGEATDEQADVVVDRHALERGVGAPAVDGVAPGVAGDDDVRQLDGSAHLERERAPLLGTVVRGPHVDQAERCRRATGPPVRRRARRGPDRCRACPRSAARACRRPRTRWRRRSGPDASPPLSSESKIHTALPAGGVASTRPPPPNSPPEFPSSRCEVVEGHVSRQVEDAVRRRADRRHVGVAGDGHVAADDVEVGAAPGQVGRRVAERVG